MEVEKGFHFILYGLLRGIPLYSNRSERGVKLFLLLCSTGRGVGDEGIALYSNRSERGVKLVF